MSTVRASCGTCGTVELDILGVVVRCCEDTDEHACRFRCPKCGLPTVTSVTFRFAAVLQSAGAPTEHWRLPLEMFERPEDGPAFDLHDLIDFYEELDQLPTVDVGSFE